jgi:hypothetical protein
VVGVFDRDGELVWRLAWEVSSAEASAALGLLAGLRVRADSWQPPVAYDRAALPLSWARAGRSGMDVKDVLLARQMEPDGRVYDADGFTLRHAVLAEDPYTGRRIVFDQVEDRAAFKIELDHAVSLSDAHTSGGYRWEPGGRNWPRLANDPRGIIAVSKTANAAKGARNAAGWLPDNPAHDFRRRLVVIQIQVKARHSLSVTESEAAAMRGVLA